MFPKIQIVGPVTICLLCVRCEGPPRRADYTANLGTPTDLSLCADCAAEARAAKEVVSIRTIRPMTIETR